MEHLRYFSGVTKLREAHALYRELAKRLHPDNKATGNAEWFKEMAAEYDFIKTCLRNRIPTSATCLEDIPRVEPAVITDSSPPSQPTWRKNREMEEAIDDFAEATKKIIVTWLKSFF